mgnify:CR=1 FL=1
MSDKIKVDINIKSYKIGRILETLLVESLSDFERRHPRIIPALKRGFRNGDPRTGLEKIQELQKLVDALKDDLDEIERITKDYLSKDLVLEEGKAVGPFLNPEGQTTYSMKNDEEIRIGPEKKKPVKKKASKKKSKKE